MNKWILAVAALTAVLSLSACSTANDASSTPTSSNVQQDPATQLPNPIVPYDTLEEAEAVVGFTVPPLNLPEGCQLESVSVLADTLVQLNYRDGETSFQYRAAKGDTDISGDYNSYEATGLHTIGGKEVTVKQQDGLTRLALWTSEEYTFSLSFPEGIDGEQLEALFSPQLVL